MRLGARFNSTNDREGDKEGVWTGDKDIKKVE
jgi:hypothetical protein